MATRDDKNDQNLDSSSPLNEPTLGEERPVALSFLKETPAEGAEDDDFKHLNDIENILDLKEEQYPEFTLAKNKARFLRMLSWYRSKEEWLKVAPFSGVNKLFKQQTKELAGIRSNKMDYEMELEMRTLNT